MKMMSRIDSILSLCRFRTAEADNSILLGILSLPFRASDHNELLFLPLITVVLFDIRRKWIVYEYYKQKKLANNNNFQYILQNAFLVKQDKNTKVIHQLNINSNDQTNIELLELDQDILHLCLIHNKHAIAEVVLSDDDNHSSLIIRNTILHNREFIKNYLNGYMAMKCSFFTWLSRYASYDKVVSSLIRSSK